MMVKDGLFTGARWKRSWAAQLARGDEGHVPVARRPGDGGGGVD